ncbi:amidase family protein [Pseudomonas sp. K5002]|uniref:amidase family protein n=1 Tax=Pseudomonas sp. K5002 TaxID=2738828 RepID=UPI0027413687|nr:amidase family protein [Pseudomonas sp. K5002]
MMRDVFICDAIRTPIGRFGGGLSTVRADDLAALPIKALMERNPSVEWSAVDEVFLGCANQAGEDNRNVARMAAFHEHYDVLVSPMMPITAFEAGHNVPPGSGLGEWMEWTPFTYPFNLTQQPAASVPCGLAANGLPVGLHVVGARFADEQVLKVCQVYARAFPTQHLQTPKTPT